MTSLSMAQIFGILLDVYHTEDYKVQDGSIIFLMVHMAAKMEFDAPTRLYSAFGGDDGDTETQCW